MLPRECEMSEIDLFVSRAGLMWVISRKLSVLSRQCVALLELSE